VSSRPGVDLEDYVAWAHDLLVEGRERANLSLLLVEITGGRSRRIHVTQEQFRQVLATVGSAG